MSGLTIPDAQRPLVDGKGQCCHIPSTQAQNTPTLSFAQALGWIDPKNREAVVEFSRQRLRRRRNTAANVLRDYAPLPLGFEDQRRGRWYPVTACGTVPASGGMTLEMRASGRIDRYGIMRCASVWTCPECTQRIAAARGKQIKSMIDEARAQHCRVEMVTFTLPHDLSLDFATCFNRLKEALNRFSSDGTAARRLKALGWLGQVRAIEITRGFTSGWHVHAHAILVFDPIADFRIAGLIDVWPRATAKEDFAASLELKKTLYPIWKRVAQRAGSDTPPTFRHGLDVRAVWSGNDYLAKLPEAATSKADTGKPRWGADAELAKSYMKEGRKKSLTIWEILDRAADNPDYAQLFRDYAAGTWGRSQIEWSKGVRDLRRIFLPQQKELTDEELAIADPEWVFADECDLPDLGQENLVIERVAIAARDAWRARFYRFGSLDRACAAVENGDALSLAKRLEAEGWLVTERAAVGYATELQERPDGTFKEVVIIKAAEFVATWPEASA